MTQIVFVVSDSSCPDDEVVRAVYSTIEAARLHRADECDSPWSVVTDEMEQRFTRDGYRLRLEGFELDNPGDL